MGLQVPEVDRRIARLQPGEQIIGINHYGGPALNRVDLARDVQVRLNLDAGDWIATDAPGIEVLRWGWVEEPPPDDAPGIHEDPLGILWVVYRDA